MHDSEDEDDLSEAESLELDGVYDRVSLTSVGAGCLVPNHTELVSDCVLLCVITADHALCSPMTTMGIPINSSLSSKEKVIIMNDGWIVSPLRCICATHRSSLFCRV